MPPGAGGDRGPPRAGLQVDQRQAERPGGYHLLHRPALDRAEGGAQGLVAPQDLAQGRLQGRAIEGSLEADARRLVVRSARRVELLQDPELLLLERDGEGAAARLADHGRLPRQSPRPHCLGGQLRRSGRLEHRAQGEPGVEPLRQQAQEVGGQQRVAAQVEEAVVDAHTVEPQHLPHGLGHLPLGLVARLGVGHLQAGTRVEGGRSGAKLFQSAPGVEARGLAQGRLQVAGADQDLGAPYAA